MKNPNCDNDKCLSENGQVRVLPTGGDSNVILCDACFRHEMRFCTERNRELSPANQIKLPTWDSLKVYGEVAVSYDPKDARLIAAAPALLSALQRLYECPDLNMDDLEPETREAMKQAGDALVLAGVPEMIEEALR